MKYLFTTFLSFIILLICQCQSNKGDIDFSKIDNKIKSLEIHLGSYPPSFKDDNEKTKVERDYHELEKELLDLNKSHAKNKDVNYKLGELYEMGHNMDIKEAFSNSKNYYKEAIKLDTNFYTAHLGLAILLVNSDIENAPEAEKEFLKVLKCPDKKIVVSANQGLFFAMYYQGKMKKAKYYLQNYIENSNDTTAIKMLKIVDEKINESEQK